MAVLTRKNLLAAGGLLLLGYIARRARSFYLESREAVPAPAPRLEAPRKRASGGKRTAAKRKAAAPAPAPSANAGDEHLHVSLGEFVPGGQINV